MVWLSADFACLPRGPAVSVDDLGEPQKSDLSSKMVLLPNHCSKEMTASSSGDHVRREDHWRVLSP